MRENPVLTEGSSQIQTQKNPGRIKQSPHPDADMQVFFHMKLLIS